MCRIAAYFGPPRSARDLLLGGDHSLASQAWAPRELLHGSVNVDGWGVAWCDEMGVGRTTRMEPTWHDPDLEGLLRRIHSGAMLAALRNTTPGIPVDASGTAPFVHDGWGFALNGFIPDFRAHHMRALRAGLSDAGYSRLTGVSDTETLFLLILERLKVGVTPLDALMGVRELVRDRLAGGESAPLTMALLSADGLWILNSSAGGPVNSLYLGEGVEPIGVGVTVASEALAAGHWQAVPPHHAAVVTGSGWEIVPV